jgi:4-aminobutyrate aminotransferase-like enzyme
LFKSENINSKKAISNDEIINYRKKHLGKSLKLHYNKPIRIVRGVGQYLMDNTGRLYLDTINNVAHVGHENPEVVIAGQKQMALLNTNTRYLHDGINTLAEKLLKTLPKELSVCYFVNSGSEANELAIRMMKEYTGQKDIIVSQWGYHGNTNKCVDISSYKFDRKGGKGAPKNTHVIPIPNSYRGKYRGSNTGNDYSKEVKKCIDNIHSKKRGVGGFIIEPIISCGGQVELPNGFLKKSYNHIRKAGGVCISDEVQVGCGRLGESFWGFQLHDVIPDIITIGKPFGNGHPIGAVVCREEIAEKFANGMEFFNTFGGNPVSCSIATEVLSFIEKYNLQKNAMITGNYLKKQLIKLAKKYPIIGEVRGKGLFLGIELTDNELTPLKHHANYLVNRMKEFGILMSTDGPDDNVIKIKPPIIFKREDCDKLFFYLDKIFEEDFMKFY